MHFRQSPVWPYGFTSLAPRSIPPNHSDSKLSEREIKLARRESILLALTSRLMNSQENERLHIARELHDDVSQRLALATSEIGTLVAEEVEPSILKDRLKVVLHDLNLLCTDVHRISHGLHSFKLQYLGLRVALSDLCKQQSRQGFEVTLSDDRNENPSSNDVSLCLYRIVQEALTNASKHSLSTTVRVTIAKQKLVFLLTIEDLGIGFDTNAIPQGLGLLSMTERVNLAGGHLSVRSTLGFGTKILVSVTDKD